MAKKQPIQVAIIGGGLGGCMLAWSLRHSENISLTIYEAGSEIKGQGTTIELSRNAEQALRLMGVDWEQLVKDIGGVPMDASPVHLGKGPATQETAFVLGRKGDEMIFSQGLLLDWIMEDLSSIRMETNKKLVSIKQVGGQQPLLQLNFKDGSSVSQDVVIGCDGIHSRTRDTILGKDHLACKPIFSGTWECKRIVSLEQAQEIMGKEYFDPENPKVHGWAGYGGFLMATAFNDYQQVAVYADGLTDEAGDPNMWSKSVPSSNIRASLETRFDHGLGILDLLTSEPDIVMTAHWESAIAPTYCRGRMCMMGDAAHASVPWLSAGAGMTLEDCLILSRLISRVQTSEDFETVFRAYDEVRRPRTQQIILNSRKCGTLLCGQSTLVGLQPDKLRASVPPLFDHARNIDLQAHVADAMACYERMVKAAANLRREEGQTLASQLLLATFAL